MPPARAVTKLVQQLLLSGQQEQHQQMLLLLLLSGAAECGKGTLCTLACRHAASRWHCWVLL